VNDSSVPEDTHPSCADDRCSIVPSSLLARHTPLNDFAATIFSRTEDVLDMEIVELELDKLQL
jgi:hypothetical protein